MKSDYLKWRIKKRTLNHMKKKFDKSRFDEGINLLGNIRAEIGLGQSCRLLANELVNSKYPITIKEFMVPGDFRTNDSSYDQYISDNLPYGINILHAEPPELMYLYHKSNDEMFDYRYNIAFWLWELEEFPTNWIPGIDLVDEIWTPSEFTSNCIRRVTNKPIVTVPYVIKASTDDKYDRDYFGLPNDKFLFLAMYDTNSTITRKNPIGTIEAFKKAFMPENLGVGLVLKMNNPRKADLQKIKAEMGDYKNIYYITDILSKVEVNSLIRDVDVFVSLHRAEGFGLVMAEAMMNGIPCIATNWSSNTEFMNNDVACMVDYRMITIVNTDGPYEKGNMWADPDINEAAYYMQRLYNDTNYYMDLSNKCKNFICEKLNDEKIVKLIEDRIERIYNSL